MDFPRPQGKNADKPLCYDPERGKFILFDELVDGRERIVPIESLSEGDVRRLVIERLRAGPDFTLQAISGPAMSRDDLVRAIEAGESAGTMMLEAETAYLRDYLGQLGKYLASR